MEIPAALLYAPQKERMMITYICETYESLQLERAAEEQLYRRLLLEAEEHRHIAETKSTTAKSVKQEAKVLVSLALQGLSSSKSQNSLPSELNPSIPLLLLRDGLENPSNGTIFSDAYHISNQSMQVEVEGDYTEHTLFAFAPGTSWGWQYHICVLNIVYSLL